ncbi:MAG: hypothetical protein M1814_006390 [Vezdaea aestivalis]|nr:MAG: hypothetical protein M1814_006390 [Vezdaea aestivalis]
MPLQISQVWGPSVPNTMPNGNSPEIYGTWSLLCAAYPYGGLTMSNMGGVCNWLNPNQPHVDFALDIGDIRLYDQEYLRIICVSRCHCEGLPGTPGVAPGASPAPPLDIRLSQQRRALWGIEHSLHTRYPQAAGGQALWHGYLVESAIWCQANNMPFQRPAGVSVSNVLQRLADGSEILPNGILATQYFNWTSFCAAVEFGGLPESNMGGVCVTVTKNGVTSRRLAFNNHPREAQLYGFADPRLLFMGRAMAYCVLNCLCVGQRDAGGQVGQPRAAIRHLSEEEWAKQRRRLERAESGGAFIDRSESESSSTSEEKQSVEKPNRGRRKKTCAARRECEDYRCGPSKESDCFCEVTRVGLSQKFAMVGCAAALFEIGSALSGRDVNDWSCPCNASYVSHQCCSSTNGLVWEGASHKLGEVHVEPLNESTP